MTHLQEIHGRLEAAAYKITDNFCYTCYKVVEGDFCPTCHSDDFMRHFEGVGVEYGTEWIIDHLIETRLEPVDPDASGYGDYYQMEDLDAMLSDIETSDRRNPDLSGLDDIEAE
jgi:hypothetical protein